MNQYEIEDARSAIFRDEDLVLELAVGTLYNLMQWTNRNSDGWAYWVKPGNASAKLQALVSKAVRWNGSIDRDHLPTAAEVRAAYIPIKSFLTKQGVAHNEIIMNVPKGLFMGGSAAS